DRDDADAGEELTHAETLQGGLERFNQDLRLDRGEGRRQGEKRDRWDQAEMDSVPVAWIDPQRIALRSEREHQSRPIDDKKNDRRPETEPIDDGGMRLERTETDQGNQRRHDERNRGEKQHHRG